MNNIKLLNLLGCFCIIILLISSCCSIPLVNCGPKITRLKLINDSIVLNKTKNRLMKFELWEYQQRHRNNKHYNININTIMAINDSLDLSIAKVCIINSNDTLFAQKPLLIKDIVTDSHRSTVYSLDFDIDPYKNYQSIIFTDIEIFDKEENKWINYHSKVQIQNPAIDLY